MSALARTWSDRGTHRFHHLSPTALWRHPGTSAVALPFLVTRAVLLALAAVVATLQRQSLIAVWNQWDSNWYLGIAQHGYHWILPGHYASAFRGATLAFFPLYPLLIRIMETVQIPGVLAGVVISNLALLGALLYMYALFRHDWGHRAARWALIIVCVFPTAFFTFAPYTESLFLLAAAGTLYHARKRQSVAAGLFFAVALLTRSTGIILLLPAILLLRPQKLHGWLALIVPAGIGWVAYITYLMWQRIPLTYLFLAQHAWHRGLAAPWAGFVGSLLWLPHGIVTAPQLAVENLGELFLTLVGVVITAVAWRDLSPPIRAYCAGFWLLVLCSPEWQDAYAAPFSSMDRFVLALFPLAGWAAATLDRKVLYRVLCVFGIGFLATSITYLCGSWIG